MARQTKRTYTSLITAALMLLGLVALPVPGALAEAPECKDAIDNDGDGYTDFPDDPGCSDSVDASEGPSPECDDNVDNDGDGAIDYPDDVACANLKDDGECTGCTDEPMPECSDGLDNDGDGDVDHPDDPDCLSPEDDTEIHYDPPPTECNDGIDNDGDGRIDYGDDPDCERYGDDKEASDIPEDAWHDRTVNLRPFRHKSFPRYKGLVVKGFVRAEVSGCVARVSVKIQRREDDRWITWMNDTTDRDGFFKVIVRDLPGRFRAVATRHFFEPDPNTLEGCRRAQDTRRHSH